MANKNKFMLKNVYVKRSVICFLGVIIIFLLVLNDACIYKTPIAKILRINNYGCKQNIELQLKNGNKKGAVVIVKNEYDSSRVYDEKYYKGDYVFLNNDYSQITEVKRDYIIAAALLFLLAVLIVVGGFRGILTSFCLLANILLFGIIILLNIRGYDILYITIAGSVIFTILVLITTDGLNWRMFISLISTLTTTGVLSFLMMLLIWHSDIEYDFLHFLTEPFTINDANHFLLSQLIIGCLGAVIDVSVTITASCMELISQNPQIKFASLLKSVHEIADDITGTMISVVLLTNIAPTLPILLMSMSNDIVFTTVLSHDAYFYIVRALSGMISILVAILISIIVTKMVARKELKDD